jgi:hypothetical protein
MATTNNNNVSTNTVQDQQKARRSVSVSPSKSQLLSVEEVVGD